MQGGYAFPPMWHDQRQHFSSNMVSLSLSLSEDNKHTIQAYVRINGTMEPVPEPAADPASVKTQEKMICSTCKEETTDWTRLTTIVI